MGGLATMYEDSQDSWSGDCGGAIVNYGSSPKSSPTYRLTINGEEIYRTAEVWGKIENLHVSSYIGIRVKATESADWVIVNTDTDLLKKLQDDGLFQIEAEEAKKWTIYVHKPRESALLEIDKKYNDWILNASKDNYLEEVRRFNSETDVISKLYLPSEIRYLKLLQEHNFYCYNIYSRKTVFAQTRAHKFNDLRYFDTIKSRNIFEALVFGGNKLPGVDGIQQPRTAFGWGYKVLTDPNFCEPWKSTPNPNQGNILVDSASKLIIETLLATFAKGWKEVFAQLCNTFQANSTEWDDDWRLKRIKELASVN